MAWRAFRPCPCGFDLKVYADGLRKAWSILTKAKAPETKFIWKTTTSKYKDYECENNLGGVGNPGVKLINQVGIEVAKEYGVDIILDQWLTRVLDLDGGDGHHCLAGPSCEWAVSQVINLVKAMR